MIVDAVSPPERPDSPARSNLPAAKSKRSLDFKVISDSVEKNVKESLVCNNNLLNNGQSQLDNSFIVPLEESFTESAEVESLKRTSSDSPDNSKFVDELFIHSISNSVFFIVNVGIIPEWWQRRVCINRSTRRACEV